MGIGNWFRNEWWEAKEAAREIKHFVKTHNWKRSAKNSVRRKYWLWWVVCILGCVAVGLIAYYRDTIVEKFEPHKDDIINFPVSYIYPTLILIILSFPPLGGHEIVLLVVGLIWGLWIGFAIACVGTFVGEMLCFFVFKYLLTKKAQEVEQKSIFYACLARLQREGGIFIISLVRFSIIPGHVVTALQSCSGMSWWKYSIAVIISLPKQLAVVWLGELFGETGNGEAQKQSRAISLTVFFVTALMSILALYSIYMRARRYYPELHRDAELRRTKDGETSTAGEEPTNLVEATMEGEHGPRYYGASGARGGGGGGGTLPYGGVYENSTTRIPMYNRTNSSLITGKDSGGGGGPFADPNASSYTIPFDDPPSTTTGGGGGGDERWKQVEERERRQAEFTNAYDTGEGGYSHLPLASASEVETQQQQAYYRAETIPYHPNQPPLHSQSQQSRTTTPSRGGYGSVDLSR
ncbi:VTT domain-containing protein [Sporobolomyces salmoneus]|uniref:VTT domain-containing protein n=1 Tax=Sporobolomyces salmoneus TaxID=183962 RepID=UPI003172AC18